MNLILSSKMNWLHCYHIADWIVIIFQMIRGASDVKNNRLYLLQ